MRIAWLTPLFIFFLALGQMGGCDIRFTSADDDAVDGEENQELIGQGTTDEETVDNSNIVLRVDSDSFARVVEVDDLGNEEVVFFGTVRNTSGRALAGLRVEVTLEAASGATFAGGVTEKLIRVPLLGQTVLANQGDELVDDGLYAGGRGAFRINTQVADEDLASVNSGDFEVTPSDSGVSEPDSSVVFAEDSPVDFTSGSDFFARGDVENDGTLEVFDATVTYVLKGVDGKVLDIQTASVSPSGGGVAGNLEVDTTGSFSISFDLGDFDQAPATNGRFLINWSETDDQ